MKPSDVINWLWQRVRYGPQTDGFADLMVSHLLWWRLWASMVLGIAGFAVGLVVLAHHTPATAVLLTWAVTWLLSPYASKIASNNARQRDADG